MRFLRSAACAIAALAILSQVTQIAAAPITSVSGGWATSPSGAGTGSTFLVSNGTVSSNLPASPSLVGSGVSNTFFSIGNVAPFAGGNTGVTTVTNGSAAGPATFVLAVPGGAVTFSLINPAQLTTVDFGPTSKITNFSQDAYLLSNTSGIDFGPLNGLWTLSMSLTGLGTTTGSPGQYYVVNGGTTGAAFTLNRAPGVFATPEPASLVVFGVLTMAGGLVARRKTWNRSVVEA